VSAELCRESAIYEIREMMLTIKPEHLTDEELAAMVALLSGCPRSAAAAAGPGWSTSIRCAGGHPRRV
jgi:hypothetical protein